MLSDERLGDIRAGLVALNAALEGYWDERVEV